MSEHLPECPIQGERTARYFTCICPELRACEKRVYERLTRHDQHSGLACLTNYEAGYADGLAALGKR